MARLPQTIMTNADNDSPTLATADAASSNRSFSTSLNSALFVLVLLLVLFGDVLAFNQLATQSPTDALLQLLVFAIGGAGIIESLRRLLTPAPTRSRASALIPGALGIAAVVVWRAELPLGISLIITSIATIISGVLAFRLLWGASRSQQAHVEVLGLLGLAQTITFGYLTVLAAVDGGSSLFG
jgi:hypothetical protein